MSKYRYALVSAIAVALAMVFSAGGAEAMTYTINGSDSGTSTAVPIDLSGASCALVNLVEVCTTTSSLSIYAGKSSGSPFSGPFTGQAVSQTVPVVGTGCSFAPTKIAACTIGSNTMGCSYSYVGGAGATRPSSSGDLFAFFITGGSLCLDGTTGAIEGTQTIVGVGGSGKAAGTTSDSTVTFRGQILLNDPAGNSFSWFTDSYTGTLTK
jgi:hypothetical protein